MLAIGPNNFFLAIGLCLAVTAVALLVLRIHIPRAGRFAVAGDGALTAGSTLQEARPR